MNSPHLIRTIGFWQAISLVIGSIIGTGIFLKLAKMSILLPSIPWLMMVWVVAGVLSYAGALTYAELATYVSKTGGEFAILYESYGPLVSFSYGWANFCIGIPGSIAAFAVGASTFLNAAVPISRFPNGIQILAISLIIILTLINCLKLKYGARFQLFLTSLKIVLIFLLILGIWFFANNDSSILVPQITTTNTTTSTVGSFGLLTFLKAFGLAMIAALWAYDGWNGLPMVAGEIKNPHKNIPLAIGAGLFVVMSLYLLVNFSYFHALSLHEIQNAYSQYHPEALPVATLAAQTFLKNWSLPLLSAAFFISALGAMNGSILMGSRVPFAMASHKLLPSQLAKVESNMHTPIWCLIIQAVMAIALASTGTFDQLTEYVIVINWIFYIITSSTIFYYRKKNKDENEFKESFKTPFFPFLPILFMISALLIVVNSVIENPSNIIKGFSFIVCGFPVFFYYNKKNKVK